MSIGTQTTYWNFIQKHGISIPVIQRDYAQGREGKEVLRSKLLGSIKDSLDDNDNGKSLVLDFVYGMKDAEGRINPLDGQQRLTTLWLLHWYLLLKSSNNSLTDEEIKNLSILSKFTYETRISSRKFCECLCKKNNFAALRKSQEDIRKEIEKQTWFMGEWKQDPTVKAMLNMLGGAKGIQEIFTQNHSTYWDRLTGDECPITFYYLSLDGEIAQTPDDIYIKMNARGEHLTDFENFKADLIKYVRDDKGNWKSIFTDQEKNPELALSQLIDSEWTNIFWSQLSEDEKKPIENNEEREAPNVDRQFFAFLNRYFLNCIFIQAAAEEEEEEKEAKDAFSQYAYGKEGKADTELKYTDFGLYENAGVITSDNFKALKQIFGTLPKNIGTINDFSKPYWDDKSTFSIFPCYEGNVKNQKLKAEQKVLKSITQKERVAFYGVCCYLENCNNEERVFKCDSFKEWMRFVWNMARNSDVETVDSMIKVISKIKEIKEHTHNIIDYLKEQDKVDKPTTYFDRQWDEEIWKATIRFNNNEETKKLLDNAEGKFHGSIRFLLSNDDNNLLNVDKASKLIYSQTLGEYKKDWFLEILPYMKPEFFDTKDVDKKLVFYEKNQDIEKIINRDDNIIDAVQKYLNEGSTQQNPDKNTWMYPLVNIRDDNSSLFDYSNAKLIRKYFHWDNNIPTGIYLYKTSQWKKDQCILLQCRSEDVQASLINRNQFIISKLNSNEGYKLAMDEEDKHPVGDKEKHLGRSIILKNDISILYCGVNGYWENDKEKIVSYENN